MVGRWAVGHVGRAWEQAGLEGTGLGDEPQAGPRVLHGSDVVRPCQCIRPTDPGWRHLHPAQAAGSLRLSGSSSALPPENPPQPFTPFLMG